MSFFQLSQCSQSYTNTSIIDYAYVFRIYQDKPPYKEPKEPSALSHEPMNLFITTTNRHQMFQLGYQSTISTDWLFIYFWSGLQTKLPGLVRQCISSFWCQNDNTQNNMKKEKKERKKLDGKIGLLKALRMFPDIDICPHITKCSPTLVRLISLFTIFLSKWKNKISWPI